MNQLVAIQGEDGQILVTRVRGGFIVNITPACPTYTAEDPHELYTLVAEWVGSAYQRNRPETTPERASCPTGSQFAVVKVRRKRFETMDNCAVSMLCTAVTPVSRGPRQFIEWTPIGVMGALDAWVSRAVDYGEPSLCLDPHMIIEQPGAFMVRVERSEGDWIVESMIPTVYLKQALSEPTVIAYVDDIMQHATDGVFLARMLSPVTVALGPKVEE